MTKLDKVIISIEVIILFILCRIHYDNFIPLIFSLTIIVFIILWFRNILVVIKKLELIPWFRNILVGNKKKVIVAIICIGYLAVKPKNTCSVSGQGFHMDSSIAIKFNSDGRFTYSDKLMNLPKSFWGTWKQEGNQIITNTDRSTTGEGFGQVNTYTYDCNKLTIGGFTLDKN